MGCGASTQQAVSEPSSRASPTHHDHAHRTTHSRNHHNDRSPTDTTASHHEPLRVRVHPPPTTTRPPATHTTSSLDAPDLDSSPEPFANRSRHPGTFATRASGALPPPGRSGSPLDMDTARRLGSIATALSATAASSVLSVGYSIGVLHEDLAVGRSQLARGYRQLPLSTPLERWDDLHVRMWLLTLPPALHRYTDDLTGPGGLLLQWDEELLSEAGVGNAFHRKQLLEYLKQLKTDVEAAVSARGDGGGDFDRDAAHAAPIGHRTNSSVQLPGGIASPRVSKEAGGKGVAALAHKRGRSKTAESTDREPLLLRVPSSSAPVAHVARGAGVPERAASNPLGTELGKAGVPVRRSHSSSVHGRGLSGLSGGARDGEGKRGGGGGSREAEGAGQVLEEYQQGKVEQSVSTLKALVRAAGELCPWPGDAAAALLSGLLDMGERALINRRNWQQLNARAVDLLQLIASNKTLQADTHAYRNLMHRLINTLKAIREYFTDFTNRNWLLRVVGAGRDAHVFGQLWGALGALVADASLGLQAGAAEGQERALRLLERLHDRQLQYDDEEARLRQAIEAQGGVEALAADPRAMAAVADRLGVGTQLTLHKIQEAVSLLEADRSEGVHSLIPHPELRVFWRKCFSPRQDVAWALWWAAFPSELTRVPVEKQVVGSLSTVLCDARRRAAFERRLEGGAPGRISVVELRRCVPADAELVAAVRQLAAVRRSTDGVGSRASSADVRDSVASVASPASAHGVAAGAGAKGHDPEATFPTPALEPRCQLPPLDDRVVGREEDVRQIEVMLVGEGGGQVPAGRQGGVGLQRSSGGGQAGGVGSGAGRAAAGRGHAVCVVGESGQGKSAVAVCAARRLWTRGSLPGGAYHVDLRGADCRAELAARFAAALGVPPPPAQQQAGQGVLLGVCAALQSLSAHGPLLLVLDGVDCLEADEDDEEDGEYDTGLLDGHGGGGGGGGRLTAARLSAAAEAVAMPAPLDGPDGGRVAAAAAEGEGEPAGPGGVARSQDAALALAELLAVAPPESVRLLLTAAAPVDLPGGRAVECYWLGGLPETAAVALVQETAKCLNTEEARQLVSACGPTPLVLRLAASAVAAGAMTLHDTVARARTALAASNSVAPTPRGRPAGLLGNPTAPGALTVGLPTSPTPKPQRSMSPVPPSRNSQHPSGAPLTPWPTTPGGQKTAVHEFDRLAGSPSADGHATSTTATTTLSTVPTSTAGAGAGLTPAGSRRHQHTSSIAKSMSFLLRGSGGSTALGATLPLQPTYSGRTSSSGAGGGGGAAVNNRTLTGGTAIAAALLSGLDPEHRTALVHLSIMPGSWDEDTASALLGQPPYAVRALLDVLLGYSLIVCRKDGVRGSFAAGAALGAAGALGGAGAAGGATGGFGLGCYSLQPGVLDAARSLLAEEEAESKVELQCRFVGHVLAQFLRADRLYGSGAVRAAMQLALELRQDVQAMLLVAATCPNSDRMLGRTVGPAALPPLAASPLFGGLVLDATAELEAFWRAVAGWAERERDAAAGALAARALANTLFKQARYVEAETAWRGALLAAQRTHGSGSLEAAACHSGLGLTLSAAGRHREAGEQHGTALKLRRAALGDTHLEVAASLSNVARVMRNTGRYREAEEAYGEALQIRTSLLGEDHPDVADSLNSAGIVAGLQKRHGLEEDMHRRALAIRQRTLGPEHPEVAQSLNNVGTALASQGKHAAAEQVFREALSIKRKVLGPGHHAVGTSLNNIARALRYQGKLQEAEQACRDAISVLEGSLGPTHPAVTTAVSNLIYLLKRQGKDAQAAAVYGQYNPRWSEGLGQLGDEAMAMVGVRQQANGHGQGKANGQANGQGKGGAQGPGGKPPLARPAAVGEARQRAGEVQGVGGGGEKAAVSGFPPPRWQQQQQQEGQRQQGQGPGVSQAAEAAGTEVGKLGTRVGPEPQAQQLRPLSPPTPHHSDLALLTLAGTGSGGSGGDAGRSSAGPPRAPRPQGSPPPPPRPATAQPATQIVAAAAASGRSGDNPRRTSSSGVASGAATGTGGGGGGRAAGGGRVGPLSPRDAHQALHQAMAEAARRAHQDLQALEAASRARTVMRDNRQRPKTSGTAANTPAAAAAASQGQGQRPGGVLATGPTPPGQPSGRNGGVKAVSSPGGPVEAFGAVGQVAKGAAVDPRRPIAAAPLPHGLQG